MSIASGASSVSVSLNGREMNLEEALDSVVRDLQKHLNMVQLQLRMLGVGSERDDDFEDQIKEADKMQDSIVEMNWLFEDLYDMSYQIVGDPETKEEKQFLKQHKRERKAHMDKFKADHKEQKKKRRKKPNYPNNWKARLWKYNIRWKIFQKLLERYFWSKFGNRRRS